jgi:uncharacterized protein (UPF0261 family)
MPRRILIVGTADTKADELLFMQRCIEEQGGEALIMDVGVLGAPPFTPHLSNRDVAKAAGSTLEALAALGDENASMTKMAEGAAALALGLYAQRKLDGLLALGGTMGTDLALEVTAALPLGMPKLIVSTIANSPLIPADRVAPDLMMMLWAGGLHGLNSICRSTLRQAAGAILGACRSAERSLPARPHLARPAPARTLRAPPLSAPPLPARPHLARPMIAVSSLGKSCLSYMVSLCPALEARGYEPVVFHCTGMGGRAMETLIAAGRFAAVFDLAVCEVSAELFGSPTSAGPRRLEAAARRGVPQIVAPGGCDMLDLETWRPKNAAYGDRPSHAHNRLISSVQMSVQERLLFADTLARKLNAISSPCVVLLPLGGIEEWDRPGQALHAPAALAEFAQALRRSIQPPVELKELACHINDPAFVQAALDVFDGWAREGRVPPGAAGEL